MLRIHYLLIVGAFFCVAYGSQGTCGSARNDAPPQESRRVRKDPSPADVVALEPPPSLLEFYELGLSPFRPFMELDGAWLQATLGSEYEVHAEDDGRLTLVQRGQEILRVDRFGETLFAVHVQSPALANPFGIRVGSRGEVVMKALGIHGCGRWHFGGEPAPPVFDCHDGVFRYHFAAVDGIPTLSFQEADVTYEQVRDNALRDLPLKSYSWIPPGNADSFARLPPEPALTAMPENPFSGPLELTTNGLGPLTTNTRVNLAWLRRTFADRLDVFESLYDAEGEIYRSYLLHYEGRRLAVIGVETDGSLSSILVVSQEIPVRGGPTVGALRPLSSAECMLTTFAETTFPPSSWICSDFDTGWSYLLRAHLSVSDGAADSLDGTPMEIAAVRWIPR